MAPGVARDPSQGWLERLDDFERRLRALEHRRPQAITIRGPRTDLGANMTGTRVEVGLTASGRYGLRVYSSTGVLTYDQTTP